MNKTETEILIVGGGIAGLVATAAFSKAGFQTICIDAETPTTLSDQRSTAFLMPSVRFLQRVGLWQNLKTSAAPLRVMRLIDADLPNQTIREQADFDASDIGEEQFGFNLPNAVLRQSLLTHIAAAPNALLQAPFAFDHLTPRTNAALVRLSDGRVVSAKLVIAADGRGSAVRAHLGIQTRIWRYGQKAMVFTVSHPLDHSGISTEVHHSGGPFTLVPLANPNQSAVVWMEKSAKVAALMALNDPEFAKAASQRSCQVLGDLTLISKRAAWPIIAQIARRLSGPRTALVAEAAHVVPPIGAQGLNMSLSDIATLLDLVATARSKGQDIGSADLLAQYNRQRLLVISARVTAIDGLNRAAMASSPLLRDVRRAGLHALFAVEPLRKTAMRLGLG